MTIIQIKSRYVAIPTEWNELSRRQLIQVMECLFLREYNMEQGKLKLLKILTGMSWWQFFRCQPEDFEEYLYLADFLLQERTGLTKQLIPEWRGLYGPCDNMSNLIMQEMTFADLHFMKWAENRSDLSALDKLVATLYRPAKPGYDFLRDPDGDSREEFNPNVCDWRAEHFISKWELPVKLAIAWWYDACRWQIVDNNDEVFGGTGEPSKYGLVSMMMSVAEDGVLGTFNDVEKQYVTIVLMKINESIANAKRQEAAMKK